MNLFHQKFLLGVLIPLEFFYIVYLVIFRPYKEIKINAIEIVNEITFLILLNALLVYNTSSDWSVRFAYIYSSYSFYQYH